MFFFFFLAYFFFLPFKLPRACFFLFKYVLENWILSLWKWIFVLFPKRKSLQDMLDVGFTTNHFRTMFFFSNETLLHNFNFHLNKHLEQLVSLKGASSFKEGGLFLANNLQWICPSHTLINTCIFTSVWQKSC